jgi:hypothetical protein
MEGRSQSESPRGKCPLAKKGSLGYSSGMDVMSLKQGKLAAFFKGFASAFDITGQTFMDDIPDFSGGFARDARALRGDWERVGNDLRKAMGQISYER